MMEFLVEVDKFSIWYGVTQCVGLLVLFMMIVWCVHYQGGLGWRWSAYELNVHPLMMTLGFIYIMANSLMLYRGLKQLSKTRLKQMHAALHLVSLLCIIIGLVAVWDYKNVRYMTNLTSLHSWIGLLTVILFVIQWAYSFLVFLYPGAMLHIRNKCMGPHVFLGLSIFMLAIVAAITGLFQQSMWVSKYSEKVYANMLGLFMLLFAALVVYILTKTEFKRLDYHV